MGVGEGVVTEVRRISPGLRVVGVGTARRRRCPTRSDCAAHNLAYSECVARCVASTVVLAIHSLIAVRFRVYGERRLLSRTMERKRQDIPHGCGDGRADIGRRYRASVKHAAERQSSRVRRVLRRGLLHARMLRCSESRVRRRRLAAHGTGACHALCG